jgi:hypothetical protein
MEGVTVKWHGEKAKETVKQASARALFMSAELLLGAANRTIPIEKDSLLERSGKPSVDNALLVAAVSYDTPYARRQHEDLTYHHSPGRRAKWLQLTLDEQTAAIRELFARVLRGVL